MWLHFNKGNSWKPLNNWDNNSILTSGGFVYLSDGERPKAQENVAFDANIGSKFQKWILKAEKAPIMDACII